MFSSSRAIKRNQMSSFLRKYPILKRQVSFNVNSNITKKFKEKFSRFEIYDYLPKYKDSSAKIVKGNQNFGLSAVVVLTGAALISLSPSSQNEEKGKDGVIGDYTFNLKERVKSTYRYCVLGISLTGASSYVMFKAGLPAVLRKINPWLYLFGSISTTVPLIIATTTTDYYSSPALKHLLWGGFNVAMASNLSLLGFYGGPMISQAFMATGCVLSGLLLAASKQKDSFSLQKFEGPLSIGVSTLIAAGLGNLIFPMPILSNVVLYGGLLTFSGLFVADTQKIYRNAQQPCMFDPINESMGLYLDAINIFARILQLVAQAQGQKKEGTEISSSSGRNI